MVHPDRPHRTVSRENHGVPLPLLSRLQSPLALGRAPQRPVGQASPRNFERTLTSVLPACIDSEKTFR